MSTHSHQGVSPPLTTTPTPTLSSHSYFIDWLQSFPSVSSSPSSSSKTSFFGLLKEQNVVPYAMIIESIFLLPVALGHIIAPAASLATMLQKVYKLNDIGSIIVQWYGINCLALAICGLLLGASGQGTVPYVLRKFFYVYQLMGEGLVIPFFFYLVHRYGEWNFFSINYVFGTIMFSTLRIISLTVNTQWFGLKEKDKFQTS